MYAENLKKIRKELRYTADEMADVLGVKKRTYGSWEREEKTPSMDLAALLCQKLNVNLNWFVAGRGEMFLRDNSFNLKSEIKQTVKEMISSGELLFSKNL